MMKQKPTNLKSWPYYRIGFVPIAHMQMGIHKFPKYYIFQIVEKPLRAQKCLNLGMPTIIVIYNNK